MNYKKFGANNKLIWKDRKRWAGLPLSFTRYFLIEKEDQWVKFFSSIGLFSTIDEELYLFRVFDITVSQTFLNKIFNEGTIVLHVNEESTNQVIIKRILNPYKVKEMLADYVEFEKRRRGFKFAEFNN